MDLFEKKTPKAAGVPAGSAGHAPLAERMRPDDISGFAGQGHLLGEGKFLRNILLRGELPSLILWGPPGCGKTTILFVDEIHRFNKSQQDAFLHSVEDGTITLIGATTENPSFEVNAPLLSRCKVLVLEALHDASVKSILERAVSDAKRGLGSMPATIDDGVL